MTIHTKRHKKLYYPAGLISLILLPVLGIWLLNIYKTPENLRIMEIYMFPKDWTNLKDEFYEYTYEVYPERNYTHINISGNDQENTIGLILAKLEVRKLLRTQDTINGIHFHFDDHSRYGTLIAVTNMLAKEKVKRGVLKDDDIWVFNDDPKPRKDKPKEYSLIGCGTHYMDLRYYKELHELIERKQQEKVVSTLKLFWFQGVLLVMMAAFSMSKIRKLRIPMNNK